MLWKIRQIIFTPIERKLKDLCGPRARAEGTGAIVGIDPKVAHGLTESVEPVHSNLETVYNNVCLNMAETSKKDCPSLTSRVLKDSPSSTTGI